MTVSGEKRWRVAGLAEGELMFAQALTVAERALARDARNRLSGQSVWSELDQGTQWEIARALGVHESHLYDGTIVREAFDRAVSEGRIVGLRFEDVGGKELRPRWPQRSEPQGARPPQTK